MQTEIKEILKEEYEDICCKIIHYKDIVEKEKELLEGLKYIQNIIKNDKNINNNEIIKDYIEGKIMMCQSMLEDFIQYQNEEIEEKERYEHQWPEMFKKEYNSL